MCWMTVRSESDALAKGIIATRRGEEISGGHSWGYAYVENGELNFEHGLRRLPEDPDLPVTDNALVHTRFATQGNITIENAHPFRIRNGEGETVAALAHNGTWRDSPDSQRFSDTWFMARLLEHNVEKADTFEEALEKTVDKVGETVVVLHRNKSMYVYSGRYPISKDGTVVQSTGFEDIRDGQLLRIDESGDETIVGGELGNPINRKLTDFVGL